VTSRRRVAPAIPIRSAVQWAARATGRLALVALAVSAVGATGCASGTGVGPRVGTSSGAERDAEIARLKDRVLELQRRLSVTEVEIDRLRREVARLKGTPIEEEQPEAVTPRRTPPRPAERPRASMSRPSDDRAGRADQAADDRGFEIEDIDEPSPRPPSAPPRAVEEAAGQEASERVQVEPPAPEAFGEDTAAPTTSAGSGGSEEITDAAQALYDRGYALYHQGRFIDAESTFQQFLQAHSGTELADNAQYWIGEARFARGDMKGALSAFREVARRFPDGNKVPDALLKAGETQAATGDAAGARATYREVMDKFPGTTAAAVAQDRLADLG